MRGERWENMANKCINESCSHFLQKNRTYVAYKWFFSEERDDNLQLSACVRKSVEFHHECLLAFPDPLHFDSTESRNFFGMCNVYSVSRLGEKFNMTLTLSRFGLNNGVLCFIQFSLSPMLQFMLKMQGGGTDKGDSYHKRLLSLKSQIFQFPHSNSRYPLNFSKKYLNSDIFSHHWVSLVSATKKNIHNRQA